MDLGRAQNNVRSRTMSCQKGMTILGLPLPVCEKPQLGGSRRCSPLRVHAAAPFCCLWWTRSVGQNDRTVTPAIYPMNQLRELLIHPTGLLPDGYFLAAPMRNFLVPQTVHWPVAAGRPFFRTTS